MPNHPTPPQASLNFRADFWRGYGASPDTIDELLAYAHNPFLQKALDGLVALPNLRFPLADEPFVTAWQGYWQRWQQGQPLASILGQVFIELNFPVELGISRDSTYRQAAKTGLLPSPTMHTPFSFANPAGLSLRIEPTLAGALPWLYLPDRFDFVGLVQRIAFKNEPLSVPDSMGACLISGYNNWARYHDYQAVWGALLGKNKPPKAMYQDRFVLLSGGGYSGLSAEAMGYSAAAWADHSVALRLRHECAHYLLRRVFGLMRNHIFDEFLADSAAIMAVAGAYNADWLLRFMGLEAYPSYRQGGRLQNYKAGTGRAALSAAAFDHLQHWLYTAAQQLAQCQSAGVLGQLPPALLLLALALLSLEEIASPALPERLTAMLAWLEGRAIS
jgi:hypothetical protein